MSHPFGDLLNQYRARKHGLSQARLAITAGYDRALITKLCQGRKELTGPSGRERVVRLVAALLEEGVALSLGEANSLMAAAGQPPLYEGLPAEQAVIGRLKAVTSSAPAPAPAQAAARVHFVPPAPLTALIGRERELEDIAQLLASTRLVTLTGAGGSGKTRLALQAAARQLDQYANGACFATLAPVIQAGEVLPAIAAALGVYGSAGQPLLEVVKYFLSSKALLLVLDNFEHVLASAPVVTNLLMAAPQLKVLATSREALHITGEYDYVVEPLAVPVLPLAGREAPDVPKLAACPAVALFVERARAAKRQFVLDESNAAAVAGICCLLGGLPLAIELAAAHVRQFTPQALLAKLRSRKPGGLDLLSNGPRDLHERQRTLRNTIAWSYRLLNPDEQRLLRLSGIFAGGAEATEIASLLNGLPPSLPAVEDATIASSLQSLCDKNLMSAITLPEGATRYSLLELIREYALERLHQCGEYEAAQHRHAEVLLALAEQSVPPIRGHGQLAWRDRLERNYPNLRAALEWCFSPDGDALIGCQLVGALFFFWHIATGHLREAERWSYAAQQAVTDRMPLAVQGRVWLALEYYTPREMAQAEQRCRRMHELFVAAGARANAAIALSLINRAVFYRGDDQPFVLRNQEAAVAQSRAAGDAWGMRYTLVMQGEFLRLLRRDDAQVEAAYKEALAVSRAAGNLCEANRTAGRYICGIVQERLHFYEALRYAGEALVQARRLADPLMESECLCKIAENLYYLGDVQQAEQRLEECLAVTVEYLNEYEVFPPLLLMAKVQGALGRRQRSRALYAQALRVGQRQRHLFNVYTIVDALAAVAAAQGDDLRAAQLRGVADHFMELNRHYRKPYHEQECATAIAGATAALGPAAYQAAYAAGRAMTAEEGLAVAWAVIGVQIGDPCL